MLGVCLTGNLPQARNQMRTLAIGFGQSSLRSASRLRAEFWFAHQAAATASPDDCLYATQTQSFNGMAVSRNKVALAPVRMSVQKQT